MAEAIHEGPEDVTVDEDALAEEGGRTRVDIAPRTVRSDRVIMDVQDVEVTYRVYSDRRPKLKDLVTSGLRNRDFREIKAVRGVTFAAYEGEAIGIVGRNGSGKSTLMQAMAGLLPTDAGRIRASAQPTLLGVGAALNPKVSGRRNIELGLLALGMPRAAVEERIRDIIEFSGLHEFIDLPLTAYSAGMKARLHFSIATAVQPDILLIDEALAVGDRGFRRKSERRIVELLDDAGTVFLVSHSDGAIRDICTRVLWIDQGKVVADGPTAEVMDAYREFSERDDEGSTGTSSEGFEKRRRARRSAT